MTPVQTPNLNSGLRQIPDIPYSSTAEQVEELPRGVHLQEIRGVIRGTVDITATGATDPTVRDLAVYKLIQRLTIEWGDRVIVPGLSGEQLAALTRLATVQSLVNTPPSPTGTGQDIEAEFIISFSPIFLARPFDMHMPPVPVGDSFEVRVDWSDEEANAGDDAGTGALITGGGETATWDTEPTLELTPIFAPAGSSPRAMPRITVANGDNFSAAASEYRVDIRTRVPFLASILHCLDANDERVDVINRVTLGRRSDFNRQRRRVLEQIARSKFPAFTTSEIGELPLLHADGGLLSNALDPSRDLEVAEYLLDVSTSGTTPDRVNALLYHAIPLGES